MFPMYVSNIHRALKSTIEFQILKPVIISFHFQKNPTVKVLRIGFTMYFRIRVPIKIKNIPKSDLKPVTISFISFPKKFSDIQFSEGGQPPLKFRILNFRCYHS